MINKIGRFALPAIALLGFGAQAQAVEGWEFLVEPYLLTPAIEGKSDIGRLERVDVDVKFDTILDNLDFATMIHAEAIHDSGWGVMLDYGLMDLRAEDSTARGGDVDVRIKQAVTQLALVQHIKLDVHSSWDIMFGIRHWENEQRVKFVPNIEALPQLTVRKEPDWTDGFIGGRYTVGFANNWQALFYGDVGLGDSDFTADLRAAVLYRINETWELEPGYNAMWVDYEEGRPGTPDRFAYDTVTHGPLLGLRILF